MPARPSGKRKIKKLEGFPGSSVSKAVNCSGFKTKIKLNYIKDPVRTAQ